MVPAARRVPRAHGRLRRPRLQRHARRSLLAQPIPLQRHGHSVKEPEFPGAGAGRAGRARRLSARQARPSRRPSTCAWRSPTSAPPSGPVTVRAGRQELVYGEQRLVGHVSWLNAARTFDGVKATFGSKPFSVDVFATSVVRILDSEFDKSGAGNRFAGVYGATTKLIPSATVEPYVLFKRDVNLRPEAGASRHAQGDDHRRSRRRQAARPDWITASRWRCSAARSAPTTSARGPATGSCARRSRAARRFGSPANTTSPRATATPPTASAGRSTSSTPRRTTSTDWPTRSAGRTSTTRARGSKSRRSRDSP